jgi:hypothetical protein
MNNWPTLVLGNDPFTTFVEANYQRDEGDEIHFANKDLP